MSCHSSRCLITVYLSFKKWKHYIPDGEKFIYDVLRKMTNSKYKNILNKKIIIQY
jgi:hypothetical protein